MPTISDQQIANLRGLVNYISTDLDRYQAVNRADVTASRNDLIGIKAILDLVQPEPRPYAKIGALYLVRRKDDVALSLNERGETDVLNTYPLDTPKIPVIKMVRQLTGDGLREAKDTVDRIFAKPPCAGR